MLFKAKLLIFLAIVCFSAYNGYKMFSRRGKLVPETSVQSPSKSVSSSPAPSPPEPPSRVYCENWGTRDGWVWGYGDGLLFEGRPDDWKNGNPVFERWRGSPL